MDLQRRMTLEALGVGVTYGELRDHADSGNSNTQDER